MATPTHDRKKTDRRVVRTRKAIMDAFDRLVVASDADKITVSAIAREADIDRKTFYLHYRSIDDLVNHKTEASLERILGVLKAQGQDLPFSERVHIAVTEVNAILTEDIDVYEHIASRLSIDQILDYFEQAATPAIERTGYTSQIIENQHMHMKLQFYIAGALSLYATWLKTDHSEPIGTISAIIEESVR